MAMLTYNGASADDPHVLEWFAEHQTEAGLLAQKWFETIRALGPDVLELLHDGYPTACIGKYPFAYVGAFKAHCNVGFYYGAELADPSGLLQGTGKRMRHVKLKPQQKVDETALAELIDAAYADIHVRLALLNPQ